MHETTRFVRKEELLRLLLAGYMLKECAPTLHLSYATVRAYVKEPGFMDELKGLSRSVWERIDEEIGAIKEDITSKMQEASAEALEEMRSLLKSNVENIKLKAAQDLMDRDSRLSRTKRLEEKHDHNFINPLLLVHAAKVAKEIDEHDTEYPGDSGNGAGRPALGEPQNPSAE